MSPNKKAQANILQCMIFFVWYGQIIVLGNHAILQTRNAKKGGGIDGLAMASENTSSI